MTPAVDKGLSGLLFILQIAVEHAVASHQQFTFIGQPDLGAQRRTADGFKFDFSIAVGGNKTGFGAGIDLPQFDAHGMNQAEGIQAQDRTSGNGKPDVAQSQFVL